MQACIADLIFCPVIQTMDSSRICHCRCFMSMVSKNFMQLFLWARKLLCYTHAWTKIHKLSSLVLVMSLLMTLPEANSNTVRDWQHRRNRLWAACPCLSSSAVVFSRSIGVEFTEHKFGFSTCANLNIRSFNLNFRYMATSKQASRHTHARAMQSR